MSSPLVRCCWIVIAVALPLTAADPPTIAFNRSTIEWAVEHGMPTDPSVLQAIESGIERARDRGLISADEIDASVLRELALVRAKPSAGTAPSVPGGTAAPRIDATSNQYGPTPGGSLIQLLGISFHPEAVVTFGGVPATGFAYQSCTNVQVTTPPYPAPGPVDIVLTNPDESSATLVDGFTYGSSPPGPAAVTFDQVVPPSGPTTGGTPVTITGTGFTAPVWVYFISPANLWVLATNIVVVDDTTITATTPPGAAGSSSIRLGGVETRDVFTYEGATPPPPVLTSFQAVAAPGSTITIHGEGFAGVTRISFSYRSDRWVSGEISHYPFTVVSPNEIHVTVPAGAVTGPIEVESIFGSASSCDLFTPLAGGPPTISSFTPDVASFGTSNVYAPYVSVTGTNFVDVRDVQIGGRPISFFVLTANTLRLTPDLSHESGPITIITAAGSATTTTDLTIVEPEYCAGVPPSISAPSSVTVGDTITLTGSNIIDPAASLMNFLRPIVAFSGSLAVAALDLWDATFVTLPVPGDAASGPVKLVTDFGLAHSGPVQIQGAPPPSLLSVTPSSGVRGSYLEMEGENLHGVVQADVAGQLDRPWIRGNGLGVILPRSSTGGDITVESVSGTSSIPFTITCEAPAITAVVPSFGYPGSPIRIFGSNFLGQVAADVWIGGARSDYQLGWTRPYLEARLPHNAKSGAIRVSTPYGSVTAPTNFLVAHRDDLNGDGFPDLFWRNANSGNNAFWLMQGAAVVGGGFYNAVPDTSWSFAGTGDFNQDGHTDLVWQNLAADITTVWYMNGPSYQSQTRLPSIGDASWRIAGVEDLDADGHADLVWRNDSTGENAVWLMDGIVPTAGGAIPPVADPTWHLVATADVNGDGRGDLLWWNEIEGSLAVWYMVGLVRTSMAFIGQVADTSWRPSAAGDFNKDVRADVIWRNTDSGDVAVWYLNGGTVLGGGYIGRVDDLDWFLAGPK